MNVNELMLGTENSTYLYGLNLHCTPEVLDKFIGIKYVLMQGSDSRARHLAQILGQKMLNVDPNYFNAINLIDADGAYACYRVGHVLCVSHGMGNSSMTKILHEISKLMYFAGNYDIEYIRIGTCGGIGIEPGNVVITDSVYMSNLVLGYKTSVLGCDTIYDTQTNDMLNKRILSSQPSSESFKVLFGNTMCADDFYLGQARFDGACKYTYDTEFRKLYFDKMRELNILNIEMESAAFASFCNRAGIPAAMLAVTIVNRAINDQITASVEELESWPERAQQVVINYIMKVIDK